MNANQKTEETKTESPLTVQGVKGFNNKPFEKTFKTSEALEKWCEANDATVLRYELKN